MRDFLKSIFGGIINLFGANITADSDWVNIPEEPLTQREVLILRAVKILQWGAIAHLLLGIILIILGAVAGNGDGSLFTSLKDSFFSRYRASADVALLTMILTVFINMSLMVVASVGVRAQEFWGILLVWLMILSNVLLLIAFGFLPAIAILIPTVWVTIITIPEIRAFRRNPVMLKELRGRMRGVRAFAIITIYLALMSSFTILLYLFQLPSSGTVVTGELGRLLFIGVVGAELVLIIFIVPALTAGAITGERERKTYDLLQTTLLPNASFIVGKMESALGYIVLLLLAAIPLQSIAFLFGGVSETEIILAFIILAVTAIALSAVGMFFSSLTEATLPATVRSYTVAFAVGIIVPFFAFLLFGSAYSQALSNVATGVSGTPAVEAGYIYLDMIATGLNPISAMLSSQQMLIDHQQLAFLNVTLSSNGAQIPIISPWILLTIIYLTATAILVMFAVRFMRRQTGR